MVQNRNQLIQLFVGNISNAVVHEILEKAINIEEIRSKYNKELKTSLDIAKYYRNKINPTNKPLLLIDSSEIIRKINNNVNNELKIRISRGYKNINLNLIEDTVNKLLKETNVIE